MSKKKSSTKTDADQPAAPPMKKGGAAKKKGKSKPDAAPATAPAAPDAPPAEATDAGQAPPPGAANATPAESAAAPAAESPATDVVVTIGGPAQAAAPETPPAGAAKGKKKGKAKKEPKPKKMSALDAAAKVLADADAPMTTGELIEAMAKAKLWHSPNGQTPAATLYSAMLREINSKGRDSRFKKAERGRFTFTSK